MTYRLFYVSNYLMDKYNKDIIAINDVGVKSPNYDAYGLFRALHSHNPFYAPLRSEQNEQHFLIRTSEKRKQNEK